jgi:xanthine dehydrogenase small subunit
MRNVIRFMLAGNIEEVRDCRPTDTVLDYLRERKQLVGTKEGCAEGDCGACTVVLAEAVGDEMRYRAVNACILFLPMLDGKQLITVEDLGQGDGGLHPVQQAMVEHHASQCGFCTPGFVMSLFAMFHESEQTRPSRADIDANLAGNLCRCTGYSPIIRAAQASLIPGRSDEFKSREKAVLAKLQAIRSDEMLAMGNGRQRYFAPGNLAELCSLLQQHPAATMLAGATDVGLWVTKQLQQPETLIHTGGVKELKRIDRNETGGYLEIGAAVTYTDALPWIISEYPEFEELLTRLGATQVRNAGTLGGNIANGSPIGDMPPGLIALGTRLVLANSGGERVIRLEDFFIDYGQQDLRPGECVARILLPLPVTGREFRTYKLAKRIEQDISAVCAAFSVILREGAVQEVRICYGGMAGTPKRAKQCEASLERRAWTADNIEIAMQAMFKDFQPISDMRASAEYRMLAARNLLKRFYLETSGAECPVRLSPRYLDTARGA